MMAANILRELFHMENRGSRCLNTNFNQCTAILFCQCNFMMLFLRNLIHWFFIHSYILLSTLLLFFHNETSGRYWSVRCFRWKKETLPRRCKICQMCQGSLFSLDLRVSGSSSFFFIISSSSFFSIFRSLPLKVFFHS